MTWLNLHPLTFLVFAPTVLGFALMALPHALGKLARLLGFLGALAIFILSLAWLLGHSPATGGTIMAERAPWFTLVGLPVDSFPPAMQLSVIPTDSADWIALTAQNGRRGAERPVVSGRESRSRREMSIAADGLWRWAFRGGSSEQAYRSFVAASVSWLLGGAA